MSTLNNAPNGYMNSSQDIDDFIAKALVRLEEIKESREESMNFLVASGIYMADGQLSPNYKSDVLKEL